MSGIAKIIKSTSQDRISMKRRKLSRNESTVMKEVLSHLCPVKPPTHKTSLKNSSYELKPLITMTLSTTHKNNSTLAGTSMTRKRLSQGLGGIPINSSLLNLTCSKKTTKTDFPMKAKEALLLYSHELTGYEQAEILDYSEVFYLGSKSSKLVPRLELSNFGFDDQNSNLKLGKGDHVAFRYEVLNLLGKGSFGQVFECFDHKRLEKVALKVIRNKKRFFQQAGIEVALLSRLRENDQNDLKPVVKMKSYFLFRKHVCITFDLWNHNLYDLIRGNKHQGLTMGLVKRFVLQLLAGLNYLNTLQIIHCDLKPENILLKHPTRSEIVIIDFGSATFDNEKIHSYIQSRFYRAPEVILGIPYTTAIDMWSLGCIVFELLTGKPLFPGESEHDQLVLIIEMLGLPSAELLLQGSKVLQFFECESCELKDPCVKSVVKVPGSRKLEDVLQINNSDLTDFIRRCLDMDAKTRLTPSQAMSHPWLSPSYKGVHSSLMEKKFGKVKIIVN